MRRRRWFGVTVLGAAALALLLGGAGRAGAEMLVTLPTNDITVMTYTGYETLIKVVQSRDILPGDRFTGIFIIQSITNASGTIDLSGQLATKEVTGAFSFTVTGGSGSSGHLEFGLAPGDFFSAFVGTGATKDYDPTQPDAFQRATNGAPWVSIQPGSFFVSVNDRIGPGGAPVNRAWADVSQNDTGYALLPETFLDLLGKPAENTYGGVTHGDYAAQLDFENHPGPTDLPAYSFKIGGFIYVDAVTVPEPASLTLLGLGALGLLGYGWRRRKQAA